MKFPFPVLVVLFTFTAAHADLVIQQEVTTGRDGTGPSFKVTIKIHGNMIRSDSVRNSNGHTASVIYDVNTGDSIDLLTLNQQETFRKTSGAEEKKFIERMKVQLGITNAADVALHKQNDTGKSEKVGGYDTEIYTWSSANGEETDTFWVAKDFPNYKNIKVDLAKLEKSTVFEGTLADISTLPGMVVKSQEIVKMGESPGLVKTTTLVSVKEEAVDPSIFAVPNDYKELLPSVKSSQPASATSSNK